MADNEAPTDEQIAWARRQCERLGVQDGDWIVMQGATREKRDAMADTIEHVLDEQGAVCELLCVPEAVTIQCLSPEEMAQRYRWQPKGADTDALMDADPTEAGRSVQLMFQRPVLYLSRLRPQDGDVVLVQTPDGDQERRERVGDGVEAALQRSGRSCLLVCAPEDSDLTELREEAMMDAGWTRIERKITA